METQTLIAAQQLEDGYMNINPQSQSPLLRLPAEIRNIIYGYCFVADCTIADPSTEKEVPETPYTPRLGVNILSTCRMVYCEADRRTLFSRNTFSFTTVGRARSFFKSLPEYLRLQLRDVEIDVKRVAPESEDVRNDWLEYLSWGHISAGGNIYTLQGDVSGLRCLRINLGCWPTLPMDRAGLWDLLRSLLDHVGGLERVVVVGASKGSGMTRHEPWSSVHYVGGDDVGADDLVQRMWRVVRASEDRGKLIRWTRSLGQIQLEVVRRDYLIREIDRNWAGHVTPASPDDAWPENGSCSWASYTNRKLNLENTTAMRFSPSVAV